MNNGYKRQPATAETAAAHVEKWNPCIRYGHEHIHVSTFGKVKSLKSGNVYSYVYPGGKGTQAYVTINPLKGAPAGTKPLTISVAKLVWETHHKRLLPDMTRMEHINNDISDNRLINVRPKGNVGDGASLPVTSVINLPVIRPESAAPTPPPPALTERDKKAIERYNRLIAEARELLTCSGAMDKIEDIDALSLTADDLVDVIDGMSVDDIAALIMNLIRLARNVKPE